MTTYELKRSTYGTWIVRICVTGERMYESTNKAKAEGVLEYLTRQAALRAA